MCVLDLKKTLNKIKFSEDILFLKSISNVNLFMDLVYTPKL